MVTVQLYVVPGPDGFTLWCNFREENEVSIQKKLSETVFIDLSAFLSSIRGPGGGTPLKDPNGDVPLDGVAFSQLEWL